MGRHTMLCSPLHLNRFLICVAGVVKVVEPGERDRQVHVRRREVWFEVDRGREVVEGRGVLARVKVNEAEVVRDDPLEGVKIQGALQARDGLRDAGERRNAEQGAGKEERMVKRERSVRL